MINDNRKLLQCKLITSEVSETDWQKIRNDLHFIERMTKLAKEKGCRLIVSGGYAVDGGLGRITRPHRDIDIQIYGKDSGEQLVKDFIVGVKEGESTFLEVELKDKGRQEYYHAFFAEGNGLGSDIYYIQVTGDPFDQVKFVIKKDGSLTDRQTYDTVQIVLEGVMFEAINPTSELVDKLYKRKIRGDVPKAEHDQDMENLKLVTVAKVVETRLAEIR
jgi:hypothetical protein